MYPGSECVEEIRRPGTSDDERGCGGLGFDALPGVEEEVETFIGKDDALPEHEDLIRGQVETVGGVSGVGFGEVIEKWTVRDDGDLCGGDIKLCDESSEDVVRMADDAVDEMVEPAEDEAVRLGGVMRKEVVNGEDDPGAATSAEGEEEGIEGQTPAQHGEVLDVDDVGRSEEEAEGEREHVEECFDKFENATGGLWQFETADDIEEARVEAEAAAGEAGGVEVVGDGADLDVDAFSEERA